jgi:agmatine deiminase
MAAEWEPHAATWLAWPHKLESWPGKFEPIPPLYARLIRTLAEHEPVHVLAGRAEVMAQAESLVGDVPNVTLHDIPTNDAWTRDHGPTFLVGPKGARLALVDWGYNAWGGKYPPFDLDDAVPRRIAEWSGRRRFEPGIILEGGAIDSNGRGTILTTEQCLLNPNRNPHLTCTDMERYLADYLGAKEVLWLGEGIEGDDTDGHIDELARFVGERTVVAALEENRDDPNYCPLRENFERLQRYTDQDGKPLDVIALPMPQPMHHEGQRLPASYCNFYIANGIAIVPQFDDPADAKVMEILARHLPGREIIGLPARDLVWGLGAFHCITQQELATG